MPSDPLKLDTWAALSHKAALADGKANGRLLHPTWVGDNSRRLSAYKILAAYLGNSARFLLPPESTEIEATTAESERVRMRLTSPASDDGVEYGDPDVLVNRVVSGVLGDRFEIVVDGADDDLPDRPELPPEPEAPSAPEGEPTPGQRFEQRVYDAALALWQQRATEIIDAWEADWAAQPALRARQEWLREWADAEGFDGKVVETEHDTVGLGDGVYVLAWSTAKQRPTITSYDPGMYFPVLDGDEFPRKVHIAWEEERTEGGKTETWVVRHTWELAPITAGPDGSLRPGDSVRSLGDGPDGQPVVRVVRQHPWNDEPATETCYYTAGEWRLRDLGDAREPDGFAAPTNFLTNEDGERIDRLDLGFDFLPVIHTPNTPATREHFGRSVLLNVAQLLDDIQRGDTDLMSAADLTGTPMLAFSGAVGGQTLAVRPGTTVTLGENGKASVIDLTKGVEVLRAHSDHLRDLLSVNAQVPAELLGRVKASEVPSGVALLLAFSPFLQLTGMLRIPRDTKYELLMRFCQRLAIFGGALEDQTVYPARLALGSVVPSDKTAAVQDVVALLQAKAISRQTALLALIAAGFAVDDARAELDRIAAEDHAGAVQIAEATASEELAAEYLGLELPEQVVRGAGQQLVKPDGSPVVTLPPAPGDEGAGGE